MNVLAHRHSPAFLSAAAVAFASLLASAPALAGDFQPKRVAADARWLAFVNVEGILKSELGKFVTEHGGELGLEFGEGDMEEIEAEFGINPLEDLRSVTVYGEGNPEENMNVVAVLETTAAIDEAIAKLSGAAADQKGDKAKGDDDDDDDDDDEKGDITTIDLNGQKVHVISDGDQTTYLQVRPGATSADRVVIVSLNREWMAKGMDVLDGKAASLASADKPAVKFKPADGTLAFAVCSDLSWIEMDDDEDEAASAIIKGSKGVEAAYGESGGDLFIHLQLDTGSKEDAQNLSDIARGLVAMARLAGGKEPELKPLMEPMRSLELKSDGNSIILNLKHDTGEFIKALNAMAEVSKKADEDEDEDAEKVEVKAEVKIGGAKDKGKDKDHDR